MVDISSPSIVENDSPVAAGTAGFRNRYEFPSCKEKKKEEKRKRRSNFEHAPFHGACFAGNFKHRGRKPEASPLKGNVCLSVTRYKARSCFIRIKPKQHSPPHRLEIYHTPLFLSFLSLVFFFFFFLMAFYNVWNIDATKSVEPCRTWLENFLPFQNHLTSTGFPLCVCVLCWQVVYARFPKIPRIKFLAS